MSSSATRSQPVEVEATTTPRFSLWTRLAVTGGALALWFWSQSLIGSRKLSGILIGDGVHSFTAPLNVYLQGHSHAANTLLIVSSGIIDLLGIYLLAKWIFGRSVRPFLGLVIVLGLRQVMQALVALPAPPNDLWHYPGFPSLLVTYQVSNDFFYSGHTSIAVFGATELWREGRPWLKALAVAIVIFEISTVLILRAHYTMDVYAGLVTALLAAIAADRICKLLELRS